MSEWWTYSLSDFLMFAPRTYYRLLERYNADLWPAQFAAVAAGVALLALVRRGGSAASRTTAGLLAAAWAWVAWAFLAERYATINWAATWMALAFALQAALLFAFALRREGLAAASHAPAVASRLGTAFTALAVLAYPAIAVFAGRGIAAAEAFGLAPDPTVLATLGVLLRAPPASRAILLPIPLAWCAVGGATLWTMRSPEWWLLPVAGTLAVAVALAPQLLRLRGGAR